MVSGKVIGVVGDVATKVGGVVGKSLGIQCTSKFLSSPRKLLLNVPPRSQIERKDSHRNQRRRSQISHRLQRRDRFARNWVRSLRSPFSLTVPTNASHFLPEERRSCRQEPTRARQWWATSSVQTLRT